MLAAVLLIAVGAACGPAGPSGPPGVHLLWRAPLQAEPDPPTGTPAVDAGRLFVADTTIQAYALGTGARLWQAPLRSYVPRALVTAHGLVFSSESTVSAFEAATGRRVWEFTPDANTSLGRAATDGSALYVGTASHRIYALGTRNGSQRWVVDVGPEWSNPAVVRGIAVAQGVVYAAVEQWHDQNGRGSTGWLVALDAGTGAVRWRYSTGETGQRTGLSSTPLVTDRLVVASDFLSNGVFAVDRRSGREVWRFHGAAGYAGVPEAPVAAGGVLYVGSGDTFVYALDLGTGRVRWRTRLQASVSSYAACGGALLANDQALTVLDPASGRVVQTAIDGDSDFPTSGIAVSGQTATLLGPSAVYAFRCA
jgi:outer membrane protein assembly factor BamB